MLAKLKTWTVRRAIYLVAGIFLVILSVVEKEFLGTLIGAYFMIMAIFNVGCAAGCCTNNVCKTSHFDSSIEQKN
ncbi:MAG: hypothetical protein NZ519_02990 [Bacteroidia bacterium]|nr:hypothetical protein [Bacteroidia bacterium]MDW8301612.1 hypothetical protein [Bacteroidia bacterium]